MSKPRPLSPHLQVYRWQLTMTLSILHRIAGAALGVGALLVMAWLLAGLLGDPYFSLFHDFKESLIGQVMLFGWLYAFVYHFLNGLRHLVWDLGYGLDLGNAYRSGWAVVVLSAVFTLLIWVKA